MKQSSSQSSGVLYLLAATCTAMIGHTIHGGIFWTVMNFLFWPLSWAKWLVFQDVTMPIIRSTFAFFQG